MAYCLCHCFRPQRWYWSAWLALQVRWWHDGALPQPSSRGVCDGQVIGIAAMRESPLAPATRSVAAAGCAVVFMVAPLPARPWPAVCLFA